jgi:phosphoribosyl 1,2-cyclic phosphodiesterase
MKVHIRGARGSIAVPGPDTVRYGGNTTCIEIRSERGDVVILDGGTGIRTVGLDLMKKLPVDCAIFITHTHWDHIQGLPFFIPLFVPGNKIRFYGAFGPVYRKDLKEILSQQMQYCYFPVRENELKAELEYTSLREGEVVNVGDIKVTSILMNHPVLNYGYKVEADGQSFFFSGDHEPPLNIYDPEDMEYEGYQALISEQEDILVRFLEDVDCMVLDSQYTAQEYKIKAGWGHGTYFDGIKLAEKAGVSQLYLTHHDPERTDTQLDDIGAELQAYRQAEGFAVNVHLAVEGEPLMFDQLAAGLKLATHA